MSVPGTSRPQSKEVSYRLVRQRRRTIGLTVDDDGLTISAPKWVSLREIEAAVSERQRWIERALTRWEQHRQRRERLRIRWQHGERIKLLGQPRMIELTGPTAHGSATVIDTGKALQIELAASADSDTVRARLEPYFVERAHQVIGERVDLMHRLSGLSPTRWQLSNARTRWGSCSPTGAIRLNWRLVHFDLTIIDYIVAHEFAHLKEMNHGPRFWRLVESICPHWRAARATLNEYPSDL